MEYRQLGNTGLSVSVIGLGGEWLERHNAEEVKAVVDACRSYGVNIIDCFMSEPNVRSNLGDAILGEREKWIIEGHIGSAWKNGQYVRTRNV
ncbi:MAG: aldo/keto reductase, partial [Clostridia bacterium]|nr:aldo/keto reductase [Clostridia bacterium]